jgi:pyruvate/2-oxoglutarate dehydrogenase complex dihydrolipoamide acyltransferase (E2) component
MFNKRPDGRAIKNLEPMQMIMPYIMKTRTDSMNMYEDTFACEPMDAYIKEKAAEGINLSYMHIIIAAVVRLIAIRPQLNRFCMNGKIYARPKIWVSFVVHPTLRDESVGTTIKLCFEGTETILEIAEKINEAIANETINRKGENGTDKLLRTLMKKIPGPFIKLVVNTLLWMDKHNIMPKAIIELSPFHTSFFITNLKSLGINHIYHHTYEFGTTGLFFAMGKEKQVPVIKGNEVIAQKEMGFGLVSDERFCDGLYFALSLRKLRRFMQNPAVLEKPLDKKVEDVD